MPLQKLEIAKGLKKS